MGNGWLRFQHLLTAKPAGYWLPAENEVRSGDADYLLTTCWKTADRFMVVLSIFLLQVELCWIFLQIWLKNGLRNVESHAQKSGGMIVARVRCQIIGLPIKLIIWKLFVFFWKSKAIIEVENHEKTRFLAFLAIFLEMDPKSISNLSPIASHMEVKVCFRYQLHSKQAKRVGCDGNIFLCNVKRVEKLKNAIFHCDKTSAPRFSLSSFVQVVDVGT